MVMQSDRRCRQCAGFLGCTIYMGETCSQKCETVYMNRYRELTPGNPDDYKTTDYCARCGDSPEAASHIPGNCAYYPPQ